MNGPPPDAVILAITGLQGPSDAAAVDAALRRCMLLGVLGLPAGAIAGLIHRYG